MNGPNRRSVKPWACLCVSAMLLSSACGGSPNEPQTPEEAARQARRARGDDGGTFCDYKGRKDREVVESTGPGSEDPNVRRVFHVRGVGEDRRRVLVCREVDTNLDGAKDLVRHYDDKGEVTREEADADYDGKIDTWITYRKGKISKLEMDGNQDEKPDELRYYVAGKLSRVQRDSNHDGESDIWEIYTDGKLERMGEDLDHDGRVDRWARDEVAQKLAERQEEEEEAKAAKEAEKKRQAAAASKEPAEGYVSPRKR